MNQIWVSRYTKILTAVTFLLIVAGGLVTSTKSGLSVPDWPLSYGQWMPPMVGGIRYEHTHRIIASLVGFMTLVLTIWIGCLENRKWVRWITISAFGAVVLQGILGGLTVMFLLPAPISIFHACLAQTFFALMVSLSYFYSKEWFVLKPLVSSDGLSEIKSSLIMMILLVYLQLILGASVRHTANHMVLVSHIASGFIVFIYAVMLMNRIIKNYENEKQLTRPAIFLGLITLFQLALGMGSFIFSFMIRQGIQIRPGKIFFITAHQSLGALLLATSVFLFLRILKQMKT